STAHVAGLLGAPVVLVVDASAQGRSVAALVSGFASFDPTVRLAAVILNRVGSARHEQILRDALAGIGTPVLGALPRDQAVTAPSRHLGLVPAAERDGAARRAIARLAALVTRSVDLDAVISLARQAGPLSTTPWDPASAVGGARDPGDDARDAGSGAGRPVVAGAGGAGVPVCHTPTVGRLSPPGGAGGDARPRRGGAR